MITAMARPNLNLYPPLGYQVTIGGLSYVGTSWPDVAAHLKAHRLANRLPLGDPEAEVNEAFCAQYPHFCHQKVPELVVAAAGYARGQPKNFTNRVLTWLADIFSRVFMHTIPLAEPAEANRRAEICAVCQFQKARTPDCITCGGDYRKISEDLRAKLGASHRELVCCGILAEDTSISVALNQKPAKVTGLPDFCWRKA